MNFLVEGLHGLVAAAGTRTNERQQRRGSENGSWLADTLPFTATAGLTVVVVPGCPMRWGWVTVGGLSIPLTCD